MKTLRFLGLCALFLAAVSAPSARAQTDWASSVQLPKSEAARKLFTGSDLSGWEGQIEKYWSVDQGTIRAASEGVVPASTYLFTREAYRNFRLLLEVRQTRGPKYSTIHSAVAVLGGKLEDKGDPFSFKGPLLMFCNDWGIWDANRRNRVYPPAHSGTWNQSWENVGEWNQIEVVVVGDHILMAANGRQVIDFTDQPGMLSKSPVGLQLHSGNRPVEYRFRGLVLSENPEERLLTLHKETK
jgi:hypothetical protein